MKKVGVSRRVVAMLEQLGVARWPLDPWEVAERSGVTVVLWEAPPELAGILFRSPPGLRSHIYVNRNLPAARRNFTVMHELVHFWFHPGFVYLDRLRQPGNRYEREANAGAAAALMPEHILRELWPRKELEYIAEYLGVSREALEIRLGELGLL